MDKPRILAIVGSTRKKETWRTVQQFETELKNSLDCEFEYVYLKDFDIQPCRGCFLCLTKGEEFCPLKDDREALVQKMQAADGVVVATPNYSLQVTAVLKNFLDRIAYTFHRPCFFHKPFIGIVTQGAIGAGDILKYLSNVAMFTGFIPVRGIGVTTVTPRTAAEQKAIDTKVAAGARRFGRTFSRSDSPRPPLMMTAMFRMVRSMYRATPDESLKDVRYWRDNGWFSTPYFYPVRMGAVRSVVGMIVDKMGTSFARRRARELHKSKDIAD